MEQERWTGKRGRSECQGCTPTREQPPVEESVAQGDHGGAADAGAAAGSEPAGPGSDAKTPSRSRVAGSPRATSALPVFVDEVENRPGALGSSRPHSAAPAPSLSFERAESLLETARAVLGRQTPCSAVHGGSKRDAEGWARFEQLLAPAGASSVESSLLPSRRQPRLQEATNRPEPDEHACRQPMRDAAFTGNVIAEQNVPSHLLPTEATLAARAWLEEQEEDVRWRQQRSGVRADGQPWPRAPPLLAAPSPSTELSHRCATTTSSVQVAQSEAEPAFANQVPWPEQARSATRDEHTVLPPEPCCAVQVRAASEAACDAILDQLDLEAQSVRCRAHAGPASCSPTKAFPPTVRTGSTM